jgi:hypothetical protein
MYILAPQAVSSPAVFQQKLRLYVFFLSNR